MLDNLQPLPIKQIPFLAKTFALGLDHQLLNQQPKDRLVQYFEQVHRYYEWKISQAIICLTQTQAQPENTNQP